MSKLLLLVLPLLFALACSPEVYTADEAAADGGSPLDDPSNPFGLAANFNLRGEVLHAENLTGLPEGDTARTYELRFAAASASDVNGALFSVGSNTNSQDVTLALTNGNLTVSTNTFSFSAVSSIADTNWHHLAVTYESSLGYAVYLDGDPLIANQQLLTNTVSSNLFVGGDVSGTAGYFLGRIDDVRIWSHMRSEAEVLTNKDHALTGQEDGLVAYYNMQIASGPSGTRVFNLGSLGPALDLYTAGDVAFE